MLREWSTGDLMVAYRMLRTGESLHRIGAELGGLTETEVRARLIKAYGDDVTLRESSSCAYEIATARAMISDEARLIRAERDTAPRFKLRPGELERYLTDG